MKGIKVKSALLSLLAVVFLFGCPGPGGIFHQGETDPPSVPKVISVTPDGNSSTSVIIKWDKADRAEYYSVYYSEGSSNASKKSAGTDILDTMHIYRDIKRGTDYYFFVRAHNKYGASEYSAPVPYVRPKLATPTGVVAQTVSTDTISLSWDYVNEAQDYNLFRTRGNNSGTKEPIATISTRTYADRNLESNTTYFYFVEANSSDGTHSELSDAVGATTKGGVGSTRSNPIFLSLRTSPNTYTPGIFPLGQHEVWYKTATLTGTNYLYGYDRAWSSAYTADIVVDVYSDDENQVVNGSDLGNGEKTQWIHGTLSEHYICIKPKSGTDGNGATFALLLIDYNLNP